MENILKKPILKIKFYKFDWFCLHIWVVRTLSLVLTYYWYLFGTRSDFELSERFELYNLAKGIPYAFLVFNLGLWLSTTKWSSNHKFLVSFLLLPALLASPAMIGMYSTFYGWSVLAIVVWSTYALWRSNR